MTAHARAAEQLRRHRHTAEQRRVWERLEQLWRRELDEATERRAS